MKLTVIGGTGTTGSAVVTEAARRGHTVTSVSRSGSRPDSAHAAVAADLADTSTLVRLVNESDATVVAVSPDRTGGPTQPLVDAFRALVEARPTGRLLIVGGAGSLLDADGHRLVDSPGFPDEFKPEALAMSAVLDLLRASDLTWSYVSPAPDYPVEKSSGAYVVGADQPAGATLSAADLALALLDEVEQDTHRGERFSVASA